MVIFTKLLQLAGWLKLHKNAILLSLSSNHMSDTGNCPLPVKDTGLQKRATSIHVFMHIFYY